MNKKEWLLKLRKVKMLTSLDRVISLNENILSDRELIIFYSAADHKYAEIVTNKYFDKVPKDVWRLVK